MDQVVSQTRRRVEVPIIPKRGTLQGMPENKEDRERILKTEGETSRELVAANKAFVPGHGRQIV
jgi:hypothetical protein